MELNSEKHKKLKMNYEKHKMELNSEKQELQVRAESWGRGGAGFCT